MCGLNPCGGTASLFLAFTVLLVLLEAFTNPEAFPMWLFTIESLFKREDVVVVNDVLGLEVSVGSLSECDFQLSW